MKRVRSGYHPVPDINKITKDTWSILYEGNYNLEECERICKKRQVVARMSEKIF